MTIRVLQKRAGSEAGYLKLKMFLVLDIIINQLS